MNFNKFFESNFIKIILFIIVCSLILFPINKYGLTDNEELRAGIFSTIYFFKNFNLSDLFTNYSDTIGPGTGLPLGQGSFFYPTNLFLFNYQLFFNFTVILNLFIQFFYIRKINKLISHNEFFYLSALFLFSFPNLSYLYFTDWISCFNTFTFYIPIIYYCVKFLKKKQPTDYFKILLFISMIVYNGHIGFGISLVFFIIPLILLNNDYFFLKKKFFYLALIVMVVILIDRLFSLTDIYLGTKYTPSAIHEGYILEDYFYILKREAYLLNKVLSDIFGIQIFFEVHPPNARIPAYGLIIFISLIYSIKITLEKKSKKIMYLNIILIIFFLLSITKYEYLPSAISGVWVFRDILNILAFVLIVNLLTTQKGFLKYSLIFLILNSVVALPEAINHLKNFKKYPLNYIDNIIKIKPNTNEFHSHLNSLNSFKKIYLGPDLYEDIQLMNNDYFVNKMILHTNDFLKYDIFPFNSWIKNQKLNSLREPKLKMYARTSPELHEINNNFFLNIFKIENILLYKKNINLIDKDLFNLINQIKTDQGVVLILQLKNIKNIILNSKKIEEIKNHKCGLYEVINCLIGQDFFLENDKIIFTRLGNLKYQIENVSNKDLDYLIPIISNNNWNLKKNIFSINPDLHVLTLKANSKVTLEYDNYNLKLLKLLSILTLIISILIVIFSKKLNFDK